VRNAGGKDLPRVKRILNLRDEVTRGIARDNVMALWRAGRIPA